MLDHMTLRSPHPYRHLGPNLLVNPGFRDCSTSAWTEGVEANGWSYSKGGDTTCLARLFDPNDSVWTLRDGDIAGWDGIGSPYGSSVFLYSTASGTYVPYIRSAKFPAIAGARYSVGVLMANHRATAMGGYIEWINTSGTTFWDHALPKHPYAGVRWEGGSAGLPGWFHSRAEGIVAPANTVAARLSLWMQTPYQGSWESDMYGFFDRAYVREEDSPV